MTISLIADCRFRGWSMEHKHDDDDQHIDTEGCNTRQACEAKAEEVRSLEPNEHLSFLARENSTTMPIIRRLEPRMHHNGSHSSASSSRQIQQGRELATSRNTHLQPVSLMAHNNAPRCILPQHQFAATRYDSSSVNRLSQEQERLARSMSGQQAHISPLLQTAARGNASPTLLAAVAAAEAAAARRLNNLLQQRDEAVLFSAARQIQNGNGRQAVPLLPETTRRGGHGSALLSQQTPNQDEMIRSLLVGIMSRRRGGVPSSALGATPTTARRSPLPSSTSTTGTVGQQSRGVPPSSFGSGGVSLIPRSEAEQSSVAPVLLRQEGNLVDAIAAAQPPLLVSRGGAASTMAFSGAPLQLVAEPHRRGGTNTNSATTPLLGTRSHDGVVVSSQPEENAPPMSSTSTNPVINTRDSGHSMVLYVDGDDEYLTEYQCLLRKQLEVFEAGPNDLRGSTQGRNTPIMLGQVGLRCRHCANLPLAARTKGAAYYSQTIDGVYQIAQNMSKVHLCQRCYRIPNDLQDKLIILKKEARRATGGKEYWAKALKAMGVYEDGNVLRLRKKRQEPVIGEECNALVHTNC